MIGELLQHLRNGKSVVEAQKQSVVLGGHKDSCNAAETVGTKMNNVGIAIFINHSSQCSPYGCVGPLNSKLKRLLSEPH